MGREVTISRCIRILFIPTTNLHDLQPMALLAPLLAGSICIEAEMLTDVQHRLAVLSRDMENHNGHRIPYQPTLSRS
jgi:hypothetical protein